MLCKNVSELNRFCPSLQYGSLISILGLSTFVTLLGGCTPWLRVLPPFGSAKSPIRNQNPVVSCRALAVPDREEVAAEAEGEVRRYDCDVGKDEMPIYQLLNAQLANTKELIDRMNSAAKQVDFSCNNYVVNGSTIRPFVTSLPLIAAMSGPEKSSSVWGVRTDYLCYAAVCGGRIKSAHSIILRWSIPTEPGRSL